MILDPNNVFLPVLERDRPLLHLDAKLRHIREDERRFVLYLLPVAQPPEDVQRLRRLRRRGNSHKP